MNGECFINFNQDETRRSCNTYFAYFTNITFLENNATGIH